jgi:hypothetical protein
VHFKKLERTGEGAVLSQMHKPLLYFSLSIVDDGAATVALAIGQQYILFSSICSLTIL